MRIIPNIETKLAKKIIYSGMLREKIGIILLPLAFGVVGCFGTSLLFKKVLMRLG